MQIREIMSRKVEGIDTAASTTDARQLMKVRRIRHLVVRRGKTVVGVVSQRDLGGTRGPVPPGTVGEVMNDDVITVESDATLRRVANLLRDHAIGCLPVMDDGELVGIVTISDVLEVVGRGEVHVRDRSRPYLPKRQGAPRKARGERLRAR